MNDRSASNLAGFLLIFSLVVSIVAIISVIGVGALNDIKQGEQVNNAERAFDVLSDNLNDVHREGAPSRATEISLQNARLETSGIATINISAWDGSGTNFTVNRTVNTTVWEPQQRDETRISYEFGAVIRDQRQGGVVITEPPFTMATDRTILPVIDTDSAESASYGGTTVRVRGLRNTPRVAYSGAGTVFTNMQIEITSPRADIWESYLERKPGTDCSLGTAPGDRDRVTCDLMPSGTTRGEIYVVVHPITLDVEQ